MGEENTLRTVGADFWAKHSISDLSTKTEYWLGIQVRLSEPVVIPPGETHYSPISWAEAFGLVGEHVRATTADRCDFYTSGRTANETAFMYQLFARALGTNNLPDCSNMCHESSGSSRNARTTACTSASHDGLLRSHQKVEDILLLKGLKQSGLKPVQA